MHKGGPPAPTFCSTTVLMSVDFPQEVLSETALIADATGMAIPAASAAVPPVCSDLAGAGVHDGGGVTKWCDKCPHINFSTKKPMVCIASPHFKGPPPISIYQNQATYRAILHSLPRRVSHYRL